MVLVALVSACVPKEIGFIQQLILVLIVVCAKHMFDKHKIVVDI